MYLNTFMLQHCMYTKGELRNFPAKKKLWPIQTLHTKKIFGVFLSLNIDIFLLSSVLNLSSFPFLFRSDLTVYTLMRVHSFLCKSYIRYTFVTNVVFFANISKSKMKSVFRQKRWGQVFKTNASSRINSFSSAIELMWTLNPRSNLSIENSNKIPMYLLFQNLWKQPMWQTLSYT